MLLLIKFLKTADLFVLYPRERMKSLAILWFSISGVSKLEVLCKNLHLKSCPLVVVALKKAYETKDNANLQQKW